MSYELISGNKIAAMTGGVFSFMQIFAAGDALLNSPVSILTAYVIAEAIGSMTDPSDGSDWPLYVASMPDGSGVKTNCGALYDTAGIRDGRLSSGEVIQHPGIQLRIRSNDYETGYAKTEKIALALDAVNRDTIVIDSVTFLLQNISRTTLVIPLGSERGTKRRFLFTVNFLVTMKRVV